jgi:hypothetical protein
VSTETPTIADVLDFYLAADRAELYVSVPGRVQSYDAAAQTVVVEPMTKKVSRDADDTRIVDILPVLAGIPVSWLRGGGYFLSMPLEAGDGGLIVFTDTDIGAWRDSGAVADPGDERRHGLGGAVFVPGLETVARALTGAGTRHLVLGKEGGPAIHIDASTVQLGAAGGNFVALANLVTAQLADLKTTINNWTPVANDGGAALKVALGTWLGSSSAVAATLVKAT